MQALLQCFPSYLELFSLCQVLVGQTVPWSYLNRLSLLDQYLELKADHFDNFHVVTIWHKEIRHKPWPLFAGYTRAVCRDLYHSILFVIVPQRELESEWVWCRWRDKQKETAR